MATQQSTGEYVVYVLLCSDNTLYTGITNDLPNRLKTHRAGQGSKYVRNRLPIKLVYQEAGHDRSSAAKREYQIKSWSRRDKFIRLQINPDNV
jgi:putative endonuclease